MPSRIPPSPSSRSRALTRVAVLRRACALGGVSLAVLAPAAHAQVPVTPSPEARAALQAMSPEARAAALRSRGFRETPDGRIVRLRDAAPAIRPANAAARVVQRAAQRVPPGPAFEAAQQNPFGLGPVSGLSASYSADPAVADLDGDGDLDVLSGSSSGSFSYFENTAGPGAPAAFIADVANPFGLTSRSGNFRPTVGDVDGDGDLDIVVGDYSGGTFVFYENTAGAGQTPAFAAPVDNPFELTDVPLDDEGYVSVTPDLVDLDGDGDLDLLAGNKAGNLYYYENTSQNGTTAFAAPLQNPFGLSDVGTDARPAVGDVDGDGDLDVLVSNSSKDGGTLFFENVAAAGAAPAFQQQPAGTLGLPTTSGYGNATTLALADLDGDGDLDLLTGGGYGSILRLYTNTAAAGSTPTFDGGTDNPNGLTPVRTLSAVRRTQVVQADLDGDGDVDVLVGSQDGAFFLFENTAGPGTTPAFSDAQASPFGLGEATNLQTFAVGDLDGDGDVDVLTTRYNSRFVYFENTAGPGATPAFGVGQSNPFGFAVTEYTYLRVPTLGDIDGDGDIDVLVGSGRDGIFTLYTNTAGPQAEPLFGAPQINPFGLTPVNPGPADRLGGGGTYYGNSAPTFTDLDGDGDLDVVSGAYDGRLFVFTNTAGPGATPAFTAEDPGTYGLPDESVSGRFNATVPTAGDLDGDGDVDLISGSYFGDVSFFENTGTVGAVTARLDGTTGYRMLAAPTATPFGTLLGSQIYTQGFPGAMAPTGASTVYRYDETVTGDLSLGYAAPASLDTALPVGAGAFVYVFEDEDPRPTAPGVQGSFPKTLTATAAPTALVDFDWGTGGDAPLTFTDSPAPDGDDGWNLLGNPFASWMDWDAVDLTNVDAPVYVYDNATANYLSHSRGIPNAGSLPGGIVGPFQGFWVKASAAAPAITARPGVSSGGPLYRDAAAQPTVVGLRLRPGAGSNLPAGVRSEAFLALGVAGAQDGVSPLDARALVPPAASFVLLATEALAPDGTPTPLAIDARPAPTGVVTVALDVSAVLDGAAAGSALVLDWPNLALPDGWHAELRDAALGTRTDLATATEYPFTLAGPAATVALDALAIPALSARGPQTAEARGAAGRFTLVVTPAGFTDAAPEAAGALALSAPRPNPTTGAASLTLSLPEAAEVRVSVYDVLGREVAVLSDGALSAGAHVLRVASASLPAGTYVVRARVAGHVLAQRLTVTR